MTRTAAPRARPGRNSLPKAPTGIAGLDEITYGGLPRGRAILVCGAAGCGKTLLGMEFLVRGATQFGEPGLMVAFEETTEEIIHNVRSLGFDAASLALEDKLLIEHIHVEPNQIEETGEYDLEGLFIRLGAAIDTIGAKRVVLDTIEALFSGFRNEAILRAEIRRLFRFLKDKGVTAVVTAERGDGTLTRYGLEEYVSDCVILIDHRVKDQVATRRLRVVKYRGSTHGTNEYPFLISDRGLHVLPITSLGLDHPVSRERVGTGVPDLDRMLGGGVYRGSSVLVTGTAGMGKSSLAAQLAKASCDRGEGCLYYAFEESRDQIVRNMSSIGLDLAGPIKSGLLRVHSTRPTLCGLESHLALIHRHVEEFHPRMVVIDPITNFTTVGATDDIYVMLMRTIDLLKSRQVTAVFTSLLHGGDAVEQTDVGISSLIDTWILLRDTEFYGERNRVVYILKSRGTAHSNQVREFLLTDDGIRLREVYLGPNGLVTGSGRVVQEARERAAMVEREEEIHRKQRELERKRAAVEAEVARLRAGFESDEEELRRLLAQDQARERVLDADRVAMAVSRGSRGPNGEGMQPKVGRSKRSARERSGT